MFCTSCSKENHQSNRFCVNCGKPFDISQVTPFHLSISAVNYHLNLYKTIKNYPIATDVKTLNAFSYKTSVVQNANVAWNPIDTPEDAASEIITISRGVTITIKRTRTIEHKIEINWKTAGISEIEAGLKNFIIASIQGEIEKTSGDLYQFQETIEHTIELSGDISQKYKLTWVDFWHSGQAIIPQKGINQPLSFRFRKRTELVVNPVDESP